MTNGRKTYEPFDPNVAESPLINYWMPEGNGNCNGGCGILRPIYSISDPVTY